LATASVVLNNAVASDAALQTYVTNMRSTMIAAGMTRVPDTVVTGQIDPTTVVRPASGAALVGFEIWQLNDSLQTTKPVYLRIEYWVTMTTPIVYHKFQAGSVVSSTGVLSGQLSTQALTYNAQQASMTLSVCAASDRFWLNWGGLTSSPNNTAWKLLVDRTRDENGVATADGFLFYCGNSTSSSTVSPTQVVPNAGAAPSAWTNGAGLQSELPLAPYFLSSTLGNVVLTNYGSAVAVCPFLCPVGTWRYALGATARSGDFVLGSMYSIPLLGTVHNMIATYGGSSGLVVLLPWE
jgi:hypothetical protein